MVFDDITEIVSAQRSAAWAEVARRLAHEIKNPLTPIQLSAERLRHKLEAKLEGADQALLLRSVATIVNQVQAMQTLVNEFRDYARLPAAQLTAAGPERAGRRGAGAVRPGAGQRPAAAPAWRRRCRASWATPRSCARSSTTWCRTRWTRWPTGPTARSSVITSVARGEHGELRAVRLTVIDNGPGFAEKVLKRAFEPYVTTKAKGTGLGLAVVKKIADEHGARLRVANLHARRRSRRPGDGGARFAIIFQVCRHAGRNCGGRRRHPRAGVRRRNTGALEGMATILVVDDELGIRALLSRSSPTRGTRSSWPRTPRRRARCANRCGPTSCCWTSGCPTSTA